MATIYGIKSGHIHDKLNKWLQAKGFTGGSLTENWRSYWVSRSGQGGKSIHDAMLAHLQSLGIGSNHIHEALKLFYQTKVSGETIGELEQNFYDNTLNDFA